MAPPVTLADFLRGGGQAQPSSGSEWADRVFRSAQQTPIPNIYPESPLIPPTFDYGTAVGRVIDPRDVTNAMMNPPTYASEHGVNDLPDYINVPQPAPPPRRELYPWWGWRQGPQRQGQ